MVEKNEPNAIVAGETQPAASEAQPQWMRISLIAVAVVSLIITILALRG